MKSKKINLENFPQAIKEAELQVIIAEENLLEFSLELAKEDYMIELAIAGDETLRNDQQRKAKKLELQHKEEYQEMYNNLNHWKFKLKRSEAELAFIKNQFTVAKLMIQQTINVAA